MLNVILTLDQQLLPNWSDSPPISWPNYEWFPWSICYGCGMPTGNAYPSGHLVPSPIFGTCLCSNRWDQITRTCNIFIRLFTWISLGSFSILLRIIRTFQNNWQLYWLHSYRFVARLSVTEISLMSLTIRVGATVTGHSQGTQMHKQHLNCSILKKGHHSIVLPSYYCGYS